MTTVTDINYIVLFSVAVSKFLEIGKRFVI